MLAHRHTNTWTGTASGSVEELLEDLRRAGPCIIYVGTFGE